MHACIAAMPIGGLVGRVACGAPAAPRPPVVCAGEALGAPLVGASVGAATCRTTLASLAFH